MWVHYLTLAVLAGILLYTVSIAQSLNVIAGVNLRFAQQQVQALPENVLVRIGGETFPAHLQVDDEGCVELGPTQVKDIPKFETAKAGLRS